MKANIFQVLLLILMLPSLMLGKYVTGTVLKYSDWLDLVISSQHSWLYLTYVNSDVHKLHTCVTRPCAL